MGVKGKYVVSKTDIENAIQRINNSDRTSLNKTDFCEEIGASKSAIDNVLFSEYRMNYEEIVAYRMPQYCVRLPKFEKPELFLDFLCKMIASHLDDKENQNRFKMKQKHLDCDLPIRNLGRSARHIYPSFALLKESVSDWFDKNRPDLAELIKEIT